MWTNRKYVSGKTENLRLLRDNLIGTHSFAVDATHCVASAKMLVKYESVK